MGCVVAFFLVPFGSDKTHKGTAEPSPGPYILHGVEHGAHRVLEEVSQAKNCVFGGFLHCLRTWGYPFWTQLVEVYPHVNLQHPARPPSFGPERPKIVNSSCESLGQSKSPFYSHLQ